jgi:hypothetical protein
MILVAGLAIAGVAGIAAAFYFSVRPGNADSERTPRVRSGASGRARTDQHPANVSRTADRPSRTARVPDRFRAGQRSAGSGATGPRARRTDRTDWPDWEADDLPPMPEGALTRPQPRRHAPPGAAPAAHGFNGVREVREVKEVKDIPGVRGVHAPPAMAGDTGEAGDDEPAPRSRRRVGWRKGSDVDEELWPVESFGGVSDEQFWDDLASDKPLATAARTALPAPGSRRRLPDVVPRPDDPGDDLSRGTGRRAASSGAHPTAQAGPNDRTASQAVPPVRAGSQPSAVATHSYRATTQPAVTGSQPYQAATQPPAANGQSYQAMTQANGGKGRTGHASTGAREDPLTSAAFSLRPKGAVDGRSQPPRRSRNLTHDQYDLASTQDTQAFTAAEAQAAAAGYGAAPPKSRRFELPPGTGTGRTDEGRSAMVGSDPFRADATRTVAYRPDPVRTDPYRPDPPRTDPPRGDRPRSDGSWSGPPGAPASSGTVAIPAYQPAQRTAGGYDGTVPSSPYPGYSPPSARAYPPQPYADSGQFANTPPYGERYQYGNLPGPAEDPRWRSSTRGYGQPGGPAAGAGSGGSRQPYPPANGYPGWRDPRGRDLRLSRMR